MVSNKPEQMVMPAITDNLLDARQPTRAVEEPVTLLTCSDIEALVRQERGSPTFPDWKPPYSFEVVAKPYPLDYKVPKFQKYNGRNKNSKEYVVRFLESMGRHSHINLCSKSS